MATGRQDQVPDHLGHRLADLGIEHAVGRKVGQPPLLEQDREDVDPGQGDEKDGHGQADEGEGCNHHVEDRVLPQGGDDANTDAKNQNDNLGRYHQDQGVGHPFPDQLQHRLSALDDRGAKVAAHHTLALAGRLANAVTIQVDIGPVIPDQPVEILDMDRLVQAKLPAQALAIGRTGRVASTHHGNRIADVLHQERTE